MCAATRYPEAIPLRTIKAKKVVQELVKFCSMFGLPKVMQTDQGSNFTSKIFTQVTRELNVKHRMSSAYHPQSQGAIERFHQTLKTLLRKFCLETGKEWDEGLPMLMFAIRETTQESVGFAPADLVFGHTVRGPLRMLREQLLDEAISPIPVLDYVSQFRDRLHRACAMAKENLVTTQIKMKIHFDKKSVKRNFQPGDSVLVLLPVKGSEMQAKFDGPYEIESQISETDYVVRTPDRRRKTRVCHVNMLKLYHERTRATQAVPSVAIVAPVSHVEMDDAVSKFEQTARLKNSEMLLNIEQMLSYLPDQQRQDIILLIKQYPSLFADASSQTTTPFRLVHDIEIEGSAPIRQHPYRVNPVKREIMKEEVKYLRD